MAIYLKDILDAADKISAIGEVINFEIKDQKIILKKPDGAILAKLSEDTKATALQPNGLLTIEIFKNKYMPFALMKKNSKGYLEALTKSDIVKSMEKRKCLINPNT